MATKEASSSDFELDMKSMFGGLDLTSGPVGKTLFKFCTPLLLANVLQTVINTVLMIYIGQYLGVNALAAVSLVGLIVMVTFAAIFGVAIAATVLIGQAMGRTDYDDVRQTIGTLTTCFLIAGIIVGALGYWTAQSQLSLLNVPEEARSQATAYLQINYLGMPLVFLSLLFQSALRGVGNSILPLWTTILNLVIHLVMTPFLMIGIGGFSGLGIAGAALTGIIANILGILILVVASYWQDIPLAIRAPQLGYLIPKLRKLKQALIIGVPMGLSSIVLAGSMVAIGALVAREGVIVLAAFGAASQIWTYLQMPAVAVASGSSAMAAQSIGKDMWPRVHRIAVVGVVTNLTLTVSMFLLSVIAAPYLFGFFLPADSLALQLAAQINLEVGWTYAITGVAMILMSVVAANGATFVPLLILIFSSIIVRLSVGFLGYEEWGASAIWLSFIAASISSAIFEALYYLSGRWKRRSQMQHLF